jgi:hypothetical protein
VGVYPVFAIGSASLILIWVAADMVRAYRDARRARLYREMVAAIIDARLKRIGMGVK